jgi:hypothetical protein
VRVVLGTGFHSEDVDTQKQVARYLAFSTAQDFWLMVYDFYGTKICDVIVQAKIICFDESGKFVPPDEGTGSPERQVFAITRTLPEDQGKLAEAFSADMPAQMAWKRLPTGTFYLPLEWASHTNGRPHVGPFLVDRWSRGERPDTMRRWAKFSRPALQTWFSVAGALGLIIWLRGC